MLTRLHLDAKGCDHPSCTEDHSQLHFTQNCHPGSGVDVYYCKEHGAIVLECHECGECVAAIQVAARG